MRMLHGETQYNLVSRFVLEIPECLIEQKQPKNRIQKQEKYDVRPKAILRPKATAKAEKPFIAQGIGDLNRIAGISKGLQQQEDTILDYGIGDKVFHIKYGKGIVLNLEREPKDYKVTVKFEKAGQKIMYASFAKLKRL